MNVCPETSISLDAEAFIARHRAAGALQARALPAVKRTAVLCAPRTDLWCNYALPPGVTLQQWVLEANCLSPQDIIALHNLT